MRANRRGYRLSRGFDVASSTRQLPSDGICRPRGSLPVTSIQSRIKDFRRKMPSLCASIRFKSRESQKSGAGCRTQKNRKTRRILREPRILLHPHASSFVSKSVWPVHYHPKSCVYRTSSACSQTVFGGSIAAERNGSPRRHALRAGLFGYPLGLTPYFSGLNHATRLPFSLPEGIPDLAHVPLL